MTQYDDPAMNNLPIEFNGAFGSSDFIYLGLDEIAYIKQVIEEDENSYGIFAADGEQIGVAPEFEIARAMAIQNSLCPVCVH
jgi:hypothetical protein